VITVTELFARLSYGPLSNLSISNEGSGGIIATKQPAIIHYANEALLRLYSKFVLEMGEVLLKTQSSVTNYVFDSKHAYTKRTSNVLEYIQDSNAKPFEDDLLKVLAVYDSCGWEFPLNDENDCESLFTPQPNVLQVPKPCEDGILHVVYQARHPKLSFQPVNLNQEIHVPFVLEEALLAYIAHKALSHMNGAEHAAKAAGHLSTFEAICDDSQTRDLVNSSVSQSNIRFSERGFV
jgi:hypothetical protein